MSSIFTEAERNALRPPEKLKASEWAEKYRILPARGNAEPGRLNLGRTPYMREIHDCIHEPGVEEIVFLKSTQVGGSTLLEDLIGYAVCSDPGPMMLVHPNKGMAKKIVKRRIRPFIKTQPLASHVSRQSHDSTLISIEFDSCPFGVAWAGSPAALAADPIRYLFLDEVDKYPRSTGKEADPISLAQERTRTFGYRRKIIITSTPTVRSGAIWRAWESAADKRRFYCPCPHCGQYQFLIFDQVKWPKSAIADANAAADEIQRKGLARYECVHCKKSIEESDRLRMVGKGRWLSEGQTIDRNGVVAGERPRAKRVGFWINCLYSPWLTFSEIAAEFLRSKADPIRLQNFKNSWLAEPFEEVVKASRLSDFRELMVGAPPALIVPKWGEYIVASCDVQKRELHWIVRAWGAEWWSQLITHGTAFSFDELYRTVMETQFVLAAGGSARAQMMCIDTRYRRDEVYQFARRDERIFPVMGADKQTMTVQRSNAGKNFGVQLHVLNTQLLKDRLAVLRGSGRWLLNDKVDDDYLRQLASEHKTIVKGVEWWQPKTANAANHRLDDEVYNVAGAEIARVDLLVAGEDLPRSIIAGIGEHRANGNDGPGVSVPGSVTPAESRETTGEGGMS